MKQRISSRCRRRVLPLPGRAPFYVSLAEVGAGNDRVNGDRLYPCLGSGRTRVEAMQRARDEFVERLSGFFQGDEPRIRASYRDLGAAAVHPNDYLLVSRRQHRRALDKESDDMLLPFDASARLEWTPLRSSSGGRLRFIPTQLVYYGYRVKPAHEFGFADSNGTAAGRSLTDAALRGVLEAVERDSVALWWYNRARRPRVALEDSEAPMIQRLCRWYRRLGRECWMLDLTSDLGIPVMAAVSRRVNGSREQVLMGFGAHVHPQRAALRALVEMGQEIAIVTAAERRQVTLQADDRSWLRNGSVSSQPQLLPQPGAAVQLSPSRRRLGTAATFRQTCRLLEHHGLEVLVADQTRAQYGRRVVKVFVPGLRPWWPRFAPGRLFEAPVRAGWRSRPIAEQSLNPLGIWF